MAAETTDTLDLKQLLDVLSAFKRGDFGARMPAHMTGLAGKIADTLNEVIETEQQLNGEWQKVGAAIREGKLTARARLPKATGGWLASVDAINGVIGDVVQPVTEMARVIFEKYVPLDRDTSSSLRPSRGLGLAFCRLAAEVHGGRIWVEDNQPAGSAFCVRLPDRRLAG